MFKLDSPSLRRALQETFDAGTLARGRVYEQQRRVLRCTSEANPFLECWTVSAIVQGSETEPYKVDVDVFKENGSIRIDGFCSCPVEENCKHTVAALLHLASNPEDELFDDDLDIVSQNTLPPAHLDPSLIAWLRRIEQAAANSNTQKIAPSDTKIETERLLYVLRPQNGRIKIELVVVKLLKNGGYGQPRNQSLSQILYRTDGLVSPLDMQLARKIIFTQRIQHTDEPFLESEYSAEMLKELLATGRCHWRGTGKQHSVLKEGPPRQAQPVWNMDEKGFQRPGFRIEPSATESLSLSPPWYVDEPGGQCGPLETGLPADVACAWISAPSISPVHAAMVSTTLTNASATLALPTPQQIEVEDISNIAPVPCLRLYSAVLQKKHFSPLLKDEPNGPVNFARLEFDYNGTRFPSEPAKAIVNHFADGKLRRLHRQIRAEERAGIILSRNGLELAGNMMYSHTLGEHAKSFVPEEDEDWIDFVHAVVPELKKKGWQVELDESFSFRFVEPESWYSDATPEKNANDWFGFELGIMVESQKINLLPVLLKMIKKDPEFLRQDILAAATNDDAVPVTLPDGRKVFLPASRVRQMMGVLVELMNPDSLNADGRLRLPKLRAAELALEEDWRWLGASELRDLSARLRNFGGIQPVPPPPNLATELRLYQQEGLNWLQFLREYELGGVLADDMGLGKTVQALAHLLIEKNSGRMNLPSLVVAPTSLMSNWLHEAARFAPDLRVLVLHGFDRKQHFDRIKDHDLIVTSYPLLPRDHAILREYEFHCLILDEAQFIKNPKTQYAQVACALRARHRICLTGTPMENHLGDLWSLFHFLLPGFLGDEIRFGSIFRRPIEKGRNEDRRKILARRVAPFILRRKKETVAKELPPKTEIASNVELDGAQRDLYESVRLAMHQRVREEVSKKGMSRSHIIILDALLKLRQICCHPQLLSLPSARKVKTSAKLELLLDIVPEMIEEGRRILLFSQFTSMLAIIETELDKLKIPYVLLTGQTTDRATPVRRFQAGEVPLFLISLKAGGTGLNLTAADTVIHYDPWWNPAVENQATDRAHRIGQDKPVFVYKLLTIGTVEEKIAAMQARKRELVEGLLNEGASGNLKMTAEDLDSLFAPLQ